MESETSCSSILGIDDVIQNDKVRYIRKGYGLIVAFFIWLGFIFVLPQMIAYVWPAMDSYTPAEKYRMTLIPIHYLTYILGNVYMFFIYKLKIPFFERYRVNDTPWPWEKNEEKWRIKCKQVFKNWLINSTIGTLMCVFDSLVGVEARTDSESLPHFTEIMWQIVLCMILEDTTFYWAHRFLHHPNLYPYIHKKHHEFYNTVSYAAEYSHPIENICANIIPTFVGAKLLGNRMHLATISLWLFMRVAETIDGHCGYEFSWSPYRLLPLSGSSEYHNFHHSHNVGNYASFFSYWDSLFGTNKDFFIYKAQKKKEIQLQKMRNEFDSKKEK